MTKPPLTGVCKSGLSTTVQPSASAGATERIERISGAFHGEMMPTTPIGTRTATLSISSVFSMTLRCSACSVRFAASRSSPTATCTSKSPFGRMPPVSRTSKFATSSCAASSKSAALRRIAARAAGAVAGPRGQRGFGGFGGLGDVGGVRDAGLAERLAGRLIGDVGRAAGGGRPAVAEDFALPRGGVEQWFDALFDHGWTSGSVKIVFRASAPRRQAHSVGRRSLKNGHDG